MTIGDVLFYPGDEADFNDLVARESGRRVQISNTCDSRGRCLDGEYYGPNLILHEAEHSEQWASAESWIGFLADYGAESIGSYVGCQDWSRCNRYEFDANPFWGGYATSSIPTLKGGVFYIGGVKVGDSSLILRN